MEICQSGSISKNHQLTNLNRCEKCHACIQNSTILALSRLANKVTGDLKIITDSRIRSIICKGLKYRFPVPMDFKSCRKEIAGALQEFCNRWCKREHVKSNALNSWKLNIFKIIDSRISFHCNNLDLLKPKPKFTFNI